MQDKINYGVSVNKSIIAQVKSLLGLSCSLVGLLLLAFLITGCEPKNRELPTAEKIAAQEPPQPEYRRLLLDNGLRVLLISDPLAERSAAAMSVGVGSLDDPPNRSGLVHFLEHMLFLGTRKYPEPDGYQNYLSSNGGFSNAYTADDHTNYFFEVSHQGYDEALDRFAQFFIAPLFNQEYAEREVKAVDSEHAKNLDNDFWRVRQVQRSHYEPEHPINRFSTGNLQTLTGVGTEELITFYRENYSSNRMGLALVSNLTLDQLERRTRLFFMEIKNQKLPEKRYPPIYLPKKPAFRLITVEPVKEQRTLALEFPLPSLRPYQKARPVHLISFVLGHEGEGSLLSLLKRRNLATELSAGQGEDTRDYSSAVLRLSLTEEGLTKYEEVIQLVLSAIQELGKTGVPPHLYEENRVMAELDFRFQSRGDSSHRASSLSAMIQSYPLEELPKAAFTFGKYNPKAVQEVLDRLHPDNMLVTLVAKGVPTTQQETHYGTRYGYQEDAGEIYQQMVGATRLEAWELPKANPFLPTRLFNLTPRGPLKLAETSFLLMGQEGVPKNILQAMQPMQGSVFTGALPLWEALGEVLSEEERAQQFEGILKSALFLPVKIVNDEQSQIWFQPDWRFRQPRAAVSLKFFTAGADLSPHASMLAQVYVAAVEEGLTEYAYPVRQAGLSYGLGASVGGLSLHLGGYSSHLLTLLDDLAPRLKTITIDEKVFATIKERIERALRNAELGQAYSEGRYYRQLLLESPNFSREALGEALKAITLQDVQAYAAHVFDKYYLQGSVVGNLEPRQLQEALATMQEALGGQPLPESDRIDTQIRLLPVKSNYVFTEKLKTNNSFASYYFQVGETNPKLRGALLILSRHLGERFYFRMRTQQQLGYIVYAGMGQVKKTLGMHFLVQSGAYSADELLRRMDKFFGDYVREFSAMPAEQFERYRASVIQRKLERPESLSDEAEQIFWRAFENDGKFDHVSEDIRAAQALTQTEVQEILQNYLQGRGARKLAVRLYGRDHQIEKPKGEPIEVPSTKSMRKAG